MDVMKVAQNANREFRFLDLQLKDLGKEAMIRFLRDKANKDPLTEAEGAVLNKLCKSHKADLTAYLVSAGAHQSDNLSAESAKKAVDPLREAMIPWPHDEKAVDSTKEVSMLAPVAWPTYDMDEDDAAWPSEEEEDQEEDQEEEEEEHGYHQSAELKGGTRDPVDHAVLDMLQKEADKSIATSWVAKRGLRLFRGIN